MRLDRRRFDRLVPLAKLLAPQLLFDDLGRPSPWLEAAIQRLGQFDAGFVAMPDFIAALRRYDLLEPTTIEITRDTLIEELVRREEKLRGNFEALVRHNRLIHDAVHRGAHNRYLEKSLAAVNDSMWLLGKSQMLLPAEAHVEEEDGEWKFGGNLRGAPCEAIPP